MFDVNLLEHALANLGELLESRGQSFELVAVGGSSLMLLGLISRPTKDLDVVARVVDGQYESPDPLPPELVEACEVVGDNLGLGDDWLNPGPAALLADGLPPGFEQRVHTQHHKGLTLHLADRFDQICLKLDAVIFDDPESRHLADIKALAPSPDELRRAYPWVANRDASP